MISSHSAYEETFDLSTSVRTVAGEIQQVKESVAAFSRNVSQLTSGSDFMQRMNHTTLENLQNRLNPTPLMNQIEEIENKLHYIESRLPISIGNITDRKHMGTRVRNMMEEISDVKEDMKIHAKKYERYMKERLILLDGETLEKDPLQARRHLMNQNLSLDNTMNVLEQIKTTGTSILGMLSEQSDALRHAREGLIDMGVSLGISQSLLRSIDRRMKMDTIIVCVGMFIVLFVLFCIWYFIL